MSSTATRRAKVVAKVAELLGAAAIVSGGVRSSRTWPLKDQQMPGLLVYAWDETKERIGRSTDDMQYRVLLTLAVDIRLQDRSRDTVEMDDELERIAGRVCDVVMKSPDLLRPPMPGEDDTGGGLIEAINAVRTSFNISTKESERALAHGRIAFEMQWTEQYDLPRGYDCDDPSFAFAPRPALPALV